MSDSDDSSSDGGTPPSDIDTLNQTPALGQVGRYVLEGEIASGGMGCVMCARDPDLNRTLAIKVLLLRHCGQWELERRFREEAQITGQLQHPGIPPVHEVGALPDGRPFFAMKLIKGRTLADLLKNRKDPTEELPRFLGMFLQVCHTLAYAHSHGVIHRDLKPANIMVGAFGEVQVMDWGLAKILRGPRSAERVWPATEEATIITPVRSGEIDAESQAGELLGTLMYMSPEQARGEVDLQDERCDVFGLGAILCVILTGKPPHRGSARSEVLARAERGDLLDAFTRLEKSGADREMIQLAQACLAPEKSGRPAHAGEVAQAVEAYQAGVEERLHRAELESARAQIKAAEESRRRRLMIALAAALLALVALAGGGGLWLQHTQGQQRLEKAANDARRTLERAARQTQLEKSREAFAQGLKLATGLRQQMLWLDTEKALDQAAERLDREAPKELHEQLRQARADARLAAELDTIRLQRVTLVDGKMRPDLTPPAYAKAFADYDLDVLKGQLPQVAERIRASEIREDMVTALYDWARFERDKPSRQRLLDVLKEVDPGRLKDQLRALMVRPDRKALLLLAAEAKKTPLSPMLVLILAVLLADAKENPVDLLQRTQEQHPRDFWINFRLGFELNKREQHELAAGYYRVAQSIRPGAGIAANNLGLALKNKGDLEGAIRAYRQAISIDGRFGSALHNLGVALRDSGKLEEAIARFREAIEHAPRLAQAHANLGLALMTKGQFAEARDSIHRAQQLLPARHPSRPGLARQFKRCERFLALESILPAVLAGKRQPRDISERLELASICQEYKQLPAAAARLYAEAFSESVGSGTRQRYYDAARAAARAGTGQGKDSPASEKDRALLRNQALGWLRINLNGWTKEAGKGPTRLSIIQQDLAKWRSEPNFAAVRESAALHKLPAEECKGWENLWSDVADLLDRAPRAEAPKRN